MDLLNPAYASLLNAWASICVAIATFVLALIAFYQITQSQQVANRPLLIPHGEFPRDFPNRDEYYLSIRNVGPGIATNVRGVMLPPEDGSEGIPQQFSTRLALPLSAGECKEAHFPIGGTLFLSKDKIVSGYTLGVPRERAPETSLQEFRMLDRQHRALLA